MEEIYMLVEERLNCMNDLKNKCDYLEGIKHKFFVSNKTRPLEMQELTQHIHHLRRQEKLRCIKENDLLEIIFSLRSFDTPQKRRFQEKSYEYMRLMHSEFVYDKYNKTGETKDIAKLYLNFFLFQKLQTKVDDLKRAYANNKFIGYPIVSILMKWLVEMVRKQYTGLIKEKTELLTNWMKNPIIGIGTSLLSETNRKGDDRPDGLTEGDKTINYGYKDPGPTIKTIETFKMDTRLSQEFNTFGLGSDKSSSQKTVELRSSVENIQKNGGRSYHDSPNKQYRLEQFDDYRMDREEGSVNRDSGLNISQNSMFLVSKAIKLSKPFQKLPLNGNCFQIFVPNSNSASCYDIIEDLDLPPIVSVYQVIQVHKQKKIPGGNLVVVDIDKKKEMMNTIYKTLYYRNNEIERTVNWYQTRLKMRNKLSYTPDTQPRKGENFCENYTVDFMGRFPHVLPQSLNASPDQNQKPRGKDCIQTSILLKTTNNFTKKLTAPSSTLETITSVVNNSNFANDQPESSEQLEKSTIPQRADESYPESLRPRSSSTQLENQFRIMKKKMSSYYDMKGDDKLKFKRPEEKLFVSNLSQSLISKNQEENSQRIESNLSSTVQLNQNSYTSSIQTVNMGPILQTSQVQKPQSAVQTNHPSNGGFTTVIPLSALNINKANNNKKQPTLADGKNRSSSVHKFREEPTPTEVCWQKVNQLRKPNNANLINLVGAAAPGSNPVDILLNLAMNSSNRPDNKVTATNERLSAFVGNDRRGRPSSMSIHYRSDFSEKISYNNESSLNKTIETNVNGGIKFGDQPNYLNIRAVQLS